MKRRLVLLTVVGLAGAWPSSSGASASALLVVVNNANPSRELNRAQLRPIFQANRTTWPSGERIEPVNLPEKTDPREAFDQAVLGFTPDEASRYWIDRKIRGDGRPPRKLTTPFAVLAYVAATPGAIGYVPEGMHAPGTRVVARVVDGRLEGP